jgi:hypothetical protein
VRAHDAALVLVGRGRAAARQGTRPEVELGAGRPSGQGELGRSAASGGQTWERCEGARAGRRAGKCGGLLCALRPMRGKLV